MSWVYEEEGCLRELMMKHAKTRVLLCDHTKLDRVSGYIHASWEDVDYLITDRCPDARWMAFLAARHVSVRFPQRPKE